jgi:predicted transcriptional regulator of viral defense system
MKRLCAKTQLDRVCQHGAGVFTIRDLSFLFEEQGIKLQKTIGALVAQGWLTRATRGVYVHTSGPLVDHVREQIALSLRGVTTFIYVSLESALYRHQLITQVPTALTLMTTGRSGRFDTPFGLIELTHTNRHDAELYGQTQMYEGPLPWANPALALKDANRTGRAQNLILDYQEQYG